MQQGEEREEGNVCAHPSNSNASRGDDLFLSYGVMGAFMQVYRHGSIIGFIEADGWSSSPRVTSRC
jgi:hypothetical protein